MRKISMQVPPMLANMLYGKIKKRSGPVTGAAKEGIFNRRDNIRKEGFSKKGGFHRVRRGYLNADTCFMDAS